MKAKLKPGQLFTYGRRVWRVSKKLNKGVPCGHCASRNGFKPCKKDSLFPCVKRCGLRSHPILVK